MNVNSERLIACNAHVDPEVEFVTIYEQRISDVLGYHRCFLNVNIVDVVNKVDSFTLTGVGWFKDPYVLF